MENHTFTHPDLKKDFGRALRMAGDNRQRLQEQRHSFLTACHPAPKLILIRRRDARTVISFNIVLPRYSIRLVVQVCLLSIWRHPDAVPAQSLERLWSYNLTTQTHKLPGTELPLVGLRVCMSPAEIVPFVQAGMDGKDPFELKDTDGGAPWGILHFRDAYQHEIGILAAKEKQLLEDAKAQARLAGVHRNVHTVLLHFSCDGVQTVFHALHIPTESVELAKKAEPFHMKSLRRGNFDIPFTRDNILSQLNMTMRNDKDNKLKVRAGLTKKDVEIMKEAYPRTMFHRINLSLLKWCENLPFQSNLTQEEDECAIMEAHVY
ncbi:hypothetical protein C8R47DRAFT_1095153 [Mycena vitilis]|nr:hypothetical protein C8R47DRAFT_1095153 [Mycena vitilis]